MRVFPLTTSNTGMSRLRTKGGARGDTLYDLLNGWITIEGTIKPRPGTVEDITLPEGTVGLVAHKCKLYVFSHEPKVTSNPDKYVVAVLRHPSDPTVELAVIHFAATFLGFLYVAAQFADGSVWHYWLEELDPWSASTDYKIGDRVFPTTENGFAYKATRPGSPNPAWAPNVERAVNDVVEPTVYNGFKYTVVAVTGDNPASGATEPDWPEEAGAQIIEYTAGNESTSVTAPVVDPNPDTGSGTYPDGLGLPYLGGGFTGGSFTTP